MTDAFWTLKAVAADWPAIIDVDGDIVSYGNLARLADQWADHYRALRPQRAFVALEFGCSVTGIAAYLGALRAAYPVLLLEPGQIDEAGGLCAAWQPDILVRADAPQPVRHLGAPPHGRALHADLRLLLSTSGSTGDPKLVRLSAENLDANAASIAEYLELTPADRAITTLPFHYSYGLSVLNSYLHAGATLLLNEESVIESSFWATARTHGATSMALVPHQAEMLLARAFTGEELPSLRYLTQAGGKLAPHLIRDLHARSLAHGWQLFVMYGQTEAAPRIAYVPPAALPAAADSIGQAIPGGRLWIAGADGQEITAADVTGELFYAGPNVMLGYAQTHSDLARGREIDSLATGDLAQRTSDGWFRIVGRAKRIAKLFGLRLSLDQMEAILAENGIAASVQEVDDRLVVLHRDPAHGSDSIGVLSDCFGLPVHALHAAHLADVPLLSSGKPDHGALRRLAEVALAQQKAKRDDRGAADVLAAALAKATRRSRVGPGDSFNSLGGDSLSYLEMHLTLEEQLGRAPDGWEDMSLQALQALVGSCEPPPDKVSQLRIDVPLRLIAIALIIIQHATDYPVFGGTWILIALIGYAMVKVQLGQVQAGRARHILARMLHPIVPLYFLLLASYGLLRDNVPPSYVMLVGNYHQWTEGSLLDVYWFVSLYAQLVLLLAIVAAVPTARQAVSGSPWKMAAIVSTLCTVVLLMLSHGTFAVPFDYHHQRGFLEGLSVALLGWLVASARGPMQALLTAGLAVACLLALVLLGVSAKSLLMVGAAMVLLAAIPGVAVPMAFAKGLTRLAAVTLYVYLLHEIIIHFMLDAPWPQFVTAMIAIVMSFGLALLLRPLVDTVSARIGAAIKAIGPWRNLGHRIG